MEVIINDTDNNVRISLHFIDTIETILYYMQFCYLLCGMVE